MIDQDQDQDQDHQIARSLSLYRRSQIAVAVSVLNAACSLQPAACLALSLLKTPNVQIKINLASLTFLLFSFSSSSFFMLLMLLSFLIVVAIVVCCLLPLPPASLGCSLFVLFCVAMILCGVCAQRGCCMARWALYNHKPPIWQLADQADLAAILIPLCGILFTIYTSVRHMAFEESLNSDKSSREPVPKSIVANFEIPPC